MGASGSEGVFRHVGLGWLGRVLRCYRECFDEIQQLRTVAHSPLLFRLYYGLLLLRGGCRIAVEELDGRVAGFAIVRDQGDGRWLLSAIGVSPSHRGHGSARRLFGMVADRRLVLSVEAGGPVGFYEKVGMRKTGEKTIVYADKSSVDALRSLPGFRAGGGSRSTRVSLNRSAFLMSTEVLDEDLIRSARARLRFFRWAIIEFPGIVPVPQGRFRAVIHEFIFEK